MKGDGYLEINNIYKEDCLVGMSKLRDNGVDHILTSPPYNRKRNDKYSFYNDDMVDYDKFLSEVINESLRIAKDYVFFNIQKNYYNKVDVFNLIGRFSKNIIDILIWNKSNPMPASGFNVTNAYEFILVLSKDKKSIKSNSTYTKNTFTTNVFSGNKYTKIHKALMHPEACEYIVSNFTKENDIILDPFVGLGTTPLTCLRLNRKYVGFEINQEYIAIANERIKDKKQHNRL